MLAIVYALRLCDVAAGLSDRPWARGKTALHTVLSRLLAAPDAGMVSCIY